MFGITPTARMRPSPFFDSIVAEGVTAFSTYNRMLLPGGFGDPEGEYRRLLEGVSMWDVAAERQVRLKGPDAARLAQILAARDVSNCAIGQGKYVPICNHRGVLLNDPILLKIADDEYWLSIADSNIWFWADAIAAERGLDVAIDEPDASPLAVQGPKAEAVVASIFGDWVRGLKYFWFRDAEIEGIPVIVQRSGWSKQGGFEIYLLDGAQAGKLWNIVKEAGRPWDIGPGCPNPVERIESGLLSWGGDTDDRTNPFEVRMGKFTHTDLPDEVVGVQALRRIKAEGPRRHQLGVILAGDAPMKSIITWRAVHQDGAKIGDLTNCIWSYRLKRNIGFGLINRDHKPGERAQVIFDGAPIEAELTELPFL